MEALRARLNAQTDEPTLRALFERALAQAGRARRQMGEAVAELEKRIDDARRPASELRRLCGVYSLTPEGLSFDDRRLALSALGFKVYANGDDPARWRHEISPLPH